MDLSGRRESQNVEDRRGSSSRGGLGGGLGNLGGSILGGGGGNILGNLLGGKGGCGCGTIVIILLIMYLLGMNPLSMLTGGGDLGSILPGIESSTGTTNENGEYVGSAEEEELKAFTVKVLASTEDVWTKQFQRMGKTYHAPKLILYSGRIQTGCGMGSSSTGPFYCSADEKVYIDLSFYDEMRNSLGAQGDFAWAYVIAHEIGHHVQNELGILGKAHQKMSQLSQTEANKVSVQIELQADFLAGLWGHDEQALYGSMEKGDLEEALNTALVIGDDYLQKRSTGRTDTSQFTHGTSAQRKKWFNKGFTTGDINQGNTFAINYNQL